MRMSTDELIATQAQEIERLRAERNSDAELFRGREEELLREVERLRTANQRFNRRLGELQRQVRVEKHQLQSLLDNCPYRAALEEIAGFEGIDLTGGRWAKQAARDALDSERPVK